MADNCGQFNAAALAQAQFSHMSNAAQMAKGTNAMNLPQQMHNGVDSFALAQDFAQMSLSANTTPQQQNMAAMNKPMVNTNWSATPMVTQPATPAVTTQQPIMQLPPAQMVPMQQNPQNFQALEQQRQQQQHIQRAQEQQMIRQQVYQQHEQNMRMMSMMQQNQQAAQQQQMMAQQQLQQLMQAQQMAQAMQMQQKMQQPLVFDAGETAEQNMESHVEQEDQSTSVFDMLRQQEDQEDAQEQTGFMDQDMEEPGFNGDISQFLYDSSQYMHHADGQSSLTGLSQSTINDMALSNDERYKNSKFVDFMQKLNRKEIQFTEDDVVEADSTNAYLNDEMGGLTHSDLWTKLQQQMHEDGDYDENDEWVDQNEWQNEFQNYWNQDIETPADYDALQEKIRENIRQYTEKIPGAFERGVELFEKGDIVNAVEMFNNCTTFEPDHSLAWMYLGKSYAQLDQDNLAIQSLEKCLSIDAYNLKALLMLGVSSSNNYVTYNSGTGTYDHRNTPIQHLYNWMTNHPDYCTTVDSSPVEQLIERITTEGPLEELVQSLSNATIKMFEDAVQVNPKDADLQTVLGVLYHINRQFDAAIQAFSTAVQLRPTDAELWNKLGATIANSGKHVEATKFYAKALALRPNYLRAKINSATAFYNLQLHHKSYPLFLDAILNSPDAKTPTCPQPHLWPLLRQSFAMCGLNKMADAAAMRDINLLKAAMQENGMNQDGSINDGFLQPIRFDADHLGL